MGDSALYSGIVLGIIAFLAGTIALAMRKRLGRVLAAIEGGGGSYKEQVKTVAAAAKFLRIKRTDRMSPFALEEIVRPRAQAAVQRYLIVALCLFGVGGLLTMTAAAAIIVRKDIDIERGIGKILYDVVVTVVFGSLIGVVTGLFVDHFVKRRAEARWLGVRRVYYVAISGILRRLLNEAVPDALKASTSAAGSDKYKPNIVMVDFQPDPREFYYEFDTWYPIIEGLLEKITPANPPNSEPLLLIGPLKKATDALEKLFQTYGPIGDPELAKSIGAIITKSIQFNDFVASTSDWKITPNIGDYYNQVIILLRLSYELRETIMATGEVTASSASSMP